MTSNAYYGYWPDTVPLVAYTFSHLVMGWSPRRPQQENHLQKGQLTQKRVLRSVKLATS